MARPKGRDGELGEISIELDDWMGKVRRPETKAETQDVSNRLLPVRETGGA